MATLERTSTRASNASAHTSANPPDVRDSTHLADHVEFPEALLYALEREIHREATFPRGDRRIGVRRLLGRYITNVRGIRADGSTA